MNVSKPFQLLTHKYAGQEIALDNCACNEAHRAQVTWKPHSSWLLDLGLSVQGENMSSGTLALSVGEREKEQRK